ncbi:hypothetical protein M0805_007059 [Coniferiporia weirii]|nr:hypothetical protein M0805_007059 [Coniferiporia weirii]
MFSGRDFPSSAPGFEHPFAMDPGNDIENVPTLRSEPPIYDGQGPSQARIGLRVRRLHEFYLQGANKHPWATLRFKSSAPSDKSLPVFFEDQVVSGKVELDLQKPESIKSIAISIKGIVCAGHDEIVFLHLSETLWDKSKGDPRSSANDLRTEMNYTEKLKGLYSWPFSIAFTPEVVVNDKLANVLGLDSVERLPPNLSDIGRGPTISYRLILDVKRHGALKLDSCLSTLIGYTPLTRPGAPSTARRNSYEKDTPVLGPSLDPDGWQIIQRLEVTGTLFRQREVTAIYTVCSSPAQLIVPEVENFPSSWLSLCLYHSFYTLLTRNPTHLRLLTQLAYTRGSVIPCHLVVESSDRQALDLLSSPQAPQIFLRRRTMTRVPLAQAKKLDLLTHENGDSQSLAKAIWAVPPGVQSDEQDDLARSLMGELSIPPSCTPSFLFGGFDLEYFVDVHPPTPAGFLPAHERVLASTPVKITSAHAEHCPRPRAFITSAHDVSRRVAQASPISSGAAYSAGASERINAGFPAQDGRDIQDTTSPSNPPNSVNTSPASRGTRRFGLF